MISEARSHELEFQNLIKRMISNRKTEKMLVQELSRTIEESTVKIKRWASMLEFKQIALDFLCQREAENCIVLGVMDRLIADPKIDDQHYFWTVHQNDQVIGAAWFTPPHPLGLTEMPTDAVKQVFHAAQLINHRPQEVLGPPKSAEVFAKLFRQVTGGAPSIKFRQKIFQLTQVCPPQQVHGSMRIAHEGDIVLLTDWNLGFVADCGLSYGSDPKTRAYHDAQDAVARQSLYLWSVDGSVVAMASAVGKTPRGIRISSVYTPPAFRARGYASALVAALSQQMLDAGRDFCFLYTDLANPISNSIYQKIGYQPVSDSVVYNLAENS